jgi:CubicO group peptidase (beta-lactamase class C family)
MMSLVPHPRSAHASSWLLITVFAVGLAPWVPGSRLSAEPPRAATAPDGARDLAVADPSTVGFSTERLTRLTDGMRKMVSDGRLAGIVTLVARHGKVVSFDAVGKQDVRKPDAMEKDSIFRIYSMTKPITGVAMMMLYEEGKWRLDDPVSKFIPEFRELKVHAGENPDGTPKLEDARRPMTMRELMTHSAGLGYGLSTANPVDRMYRDARVLDSGKPLQQMIDGLAKLPLLAQPGARWSYSIAVDVQGYLVEKLSGQKFDVFLKERIFDPLGMKDTSFHVPAAKLGRLARIHGDGKAGGLEPPSDAPPGGGVFADPTRPVLGPSGGGGLFSTAEDYLRFCQMMLDGGTFGGTRLLAPRTVEMMRTNHLQAEALRTYRPGQGFGLDFSVVMDAGQAGVPTPNGTYYWAGAAGTWFWIDPATDVVFIGMIQHRGSAVADVQGLSRNLTYQAIVEPSR